MKLVVMTQSVDLEDPILGFFHGWLEAMSSRVHELCVIAPSVGTSNLPGNVEIVDLGKRTGVSKLRQLARFVSGVRKATSTTDDVIVLAHMVPKYAVLFRAATFPKAIPLALWYTHKNIDIALRIAVPMVDRIFSAVPGSFPLGGTKVRAFGHGINTEIFIPSDKPRPEPRFLAVGRISPIKRQREIVEGFVEACRIEPTLVQKSTLELIGEPFTEGDREYAEKLKEASFENGMGESIIFSGNVAHYKIPQKFCPGDVLVNLSHHGLFDKVVLEAMSSGCLVLTSNALFGDLLGEQKEDLMLDSLSSKSLGSRIIRLCKLSIDERVKRGADLRKRVQKQHSLDHTLGQIIDEMKSLVKVV